MPLPIECRELKVEQYARALIRFWHRRVICVPKNQDEPYGQLSHGRDSTTAFVVRSSKHRWHDVTLWDFPGLFISDADIKCVKRRWLMAYYCFHGCGTIVKTLLDLEKFDKYESESPLQVIKLIESFGPSKERGFKLRDTEWVEVPDQLIWHDAYTRIRNSEPRFVPVEACFKSNGEGMTDYVCPSMYFK